MKIRYRQPDKTADISAGKGSALKELATLMVLASATLVFIYFAVGFIVDFAILNISTDTEKKIFGSISNTVRTEKTEENNKKLTLCNDILHKFTQQKMVPRLNYNIVVMNSSEVNAFAFPGGTIGVTDGLLKKLDGEIPIAFVIGHELGHFKNRDHLRGLGRAAGFGIIVAIVFGRSGPDAWSNVISYILQRTYSRKRETMADMFGVKLVNSVYGNINGTERLFEIIQKEEKLPGWAFMFSTHPDTKMRIKSLKSYAKTLQ